jgi:hypothetical protein
MFAAGLCCDVDCSKMFAGQEDNEEDVSDFEAEFIAAEPDTENENEMVRDCPSRLPYCS